MIVGPTNPHGLRIYFLKLLLFIIIIFCAWYINYHFNKGSSWFRWFPLKQIWLLSNNIKKKKKESFKNKNGLSIYLLNIRLIENQRPDNQPSTFPYQCLSMLKVRKFPECYLKGQGSSSRINKNISSFAYFLVVGQIG